MLNQTMYRVIFVFLSWSVSFFCLNIMRKHQCKLLPTRPSAPARRRLLGPFIDGPDVGVAPSLPAHQRAANGDLEPAGD